MKKDKDVIKRQSEYENKYSEIIVTYYDNETKSFTPFEWGLFELKVRKISKNIEFVLKD